jgi:hypothetical protein
VPLERVEVPLKGVVVELELEERARRAGEVGGELPGELVLGEAQPAKGRAGGAGRVRVRARPIPNLNEQTRTRALAETRPPIARDTSKHPNLNHQRATYH